MIFQIMIVESIAAFIENDLLVGYKHDSLVSLRNIIHDAVLFFSFDIESMFSVHLLSNQTITNLGRFASVLIILVLELHWTHTNRPRASKMSFDSSLFVITFTVYYLSSSIHNGLAAFPDPWV